MNPLYQKVATRIVQSCVVALPLVFAMNRPAEAVDVRSCASTDRVTLDARLAAKADQGVVSLNRFVQRTRMIHQLDLPTAMARAARYHRTVEACDSSYFDE